MFSRTVEKDMKISMIIRVIYTQLEATVTLKPFFT